MWIGAVAHLLGQGFVQHQWLCGDEVTMESSRKQVIYKCAEIFYYLTWLSIRGQVGTKLASLDCKNSAITIA